MNFYRITLFAILIAIVGAIVLFFLYFSLIFIFFLETHMLCFKNCWTLEAVVGEIRFCVIIFKYPKNLYAFLFFIKQMSYDTRHLFYHIGNLFIILQRKHQI